jgi:hypothetical protein
MSSNRCPECGLLFPLDVQNDVRITSYCVFQEDWHWAGVNMQRCEDNIEYLFDNFVPLSVEEGTDAARFRRLCAWLEERSFA